MCILPVKVFKRNFLFVKEQTHNTRRAVAVLFYVHLGTMAFLRRQIFAFVIFIHSLAIDKHNNIRILLNGSRFPQVRKTWYGLRTRFHQTRELGERKYGNVQFAR